MTDEKLKARTAIEYSLAAEGSILIYGRKDGTDVSPRIGMTNTCMLFLEAFKRNILVMIPDAPVYIQVHSKGNVWHKPAWRIYLGQEKSVLNLLKQIDLTDIHPDKEQMRQLILEAWADDSTTDIKRAAHRKSLILNKRGPK